MERDILKTIMEKETFTWYGSTSIQSIVWCQRYVSYHRPQADQLLTDPSNYYGPQIYSMLGIDTETSLKIIGISGSLSLLWTTSGLLSLDRVGRIKPLIFSATGMAAALIVNSVMAKFFVVANNPDPNQNALRGRDASRICAIARIDGLERSWPGG